MLNTKIDATDLSGWLVIDKPAGMTSTDVLISIKRLFKFRKIGHAGTLDPFATGLLLVAIGEATKLIEFVMDKQKDYDFTITFGRETDTLDFTGKTLEENDVRPQGKDLPSIIKRHLGAQLQIPPKYSAIKVNGKRAYALARENQEFELKSRPVELIDAMVIDDCRDSARLKITSGRGYYVRSLARDICDDLDVLGHVSALRRTRLGKFKECDAILLADLKSLVHNDGKASLIKLLKPLDAALDDILVRQVSSDDARKLKHGQAICIDNLQNCAKVLAKCDNLEIAICNIDNHLLVPKTVFNL